MVSPVADAAASIARLSSLADGADLGARTAERDHDPRDGRLGELGDWLAGVLAGPLVRVRLVVIGEPSEEVLHAAAESEVAVRQLVVSRDGGSEDSAIAAAAAAADGAADDGVELVLLATARASCASDNHSSAAESPVAESPVAESRADESPAAAAISAITGAEPTALLPRGAAAVDTAAWIARAGYLRETRRRILGLRQQPDELLAELGSPVIAAATAFALAAATRRTPVVLDGLPALAGAVLAADALPRARRWWLVADAADDPAHRRAVAELATTPILELGTSRGDGLAAVLAVPVLRAAGRVRAAV